MPKRSSALVAGLASVLVAASATAQLEVRPDRWAVRNVRTTLDEAAPPATLVLRHGRVESVLDVDAPVPAGAFIIDAGGWYALPAFIDAFARTGLADVEQTADQDVPVDTGSDVRIDMREANRRGVQPSFRAVEALALGDDAEGWRESGFGAALVAPGGSLLAGTSALCATRAAAARDLVLAADVFAHGEFRAPRGGYPSTLMGYIAQLRQVFLDARRHAALERRHAQGRPGPRPPYDAELDAVVQLLGGERILVVDAETDRDIRRWLKLSDDFGFRLAVSGGRDAWKMADELAVRGIPVVLTLDWGDEPEDPDADASEDEPEEGGEAQEAAASSEEARWVYEEPLEVKRDRRRRWEETRDGVLRLSEAGVTLVFGSGGDGPEELLERVRALVAAGLPADVARAALTRGAADLLGVPGRLGEIAPGMDASFGIWTADPVTEDAQLTWLFVDGEPHEFELKEKGAAGEGPAEGVDVTGAWTLRYEGFGDEDQEARMVLEMDADGAVTGTVAMQSAFEETETSASFEGSVSGDVLNASGTFTFGEFELEISIELTIEGDEMRGTLTTSGGFGERESDARATRVPREVIR
jgi:imidazolonepropionase-like amidohydrolase